MVNVQRGKRYVLLANTTAVAVIAAVAIALSAIRLKFILGYAATCRHKYVKVYLAAATLF